MLIFYIYRFVVLIVYWLLLSWILNLIVCQLRQSWGAATMICILDYKVHLLLITLNLMRMLSDYILVMRILLLEILTLIWNTSIKGNRFFNNFSNRMLFKACPIFLITHYQRVWRFMSDFESRLLIWGFGVFLYILKLFSQSLRLFWIT